MDDLERIEKSSNNKNLALLAQEMRFIHTEFSDFKIQTKNDFNELKTNTSGMYALKNTTDSTFADHERRIARLEKAVLWVLGTTFAIVFLAIIGLVVTRK